MRRHPHLYEINACLFLRRMSQKYGRALTLATIPEEEWQELKRLGFDLVWLMGVWQRSSGSRREALLHEALRHEYDRALPGWADGDVAGSPYAVGSYELDASLGKPAELAQLKAKLNRLGLGLILDFVPNHVARDHPWTHSHPQRFIQGKEASVQVHPGWFFSPGGGTYLAHGRDPYFPPWTDTAQLNYYSPDLRWAMIEELRRIAEVADGVRCDMAMLALNDVFGRIWGELAGYPRPDTEFWEGAITQVKGPKPGFLFLAEAYWGLERQLPQLGFDFTYDKALYDRLRSSSARDIRHHLMADEPYQQHSVRFIENHDEERAITAFGRERSLAAAVVLGTVPGLRLFHDGQLEGRRIRLPVQLVRAPEEAADAGIRQFYERLLEVCNSPSFHEGEWELLDVVASVDGHDSHLNIMSWCWRYAGRDRIVVVNYSPENSQGWLKLPLPAGNAGRTALHDAISGGTFVPDADRLWSQGLHLDLKPWETQIWDMTPVPAS
jgi:hypothetical protein